MRALAVMGNRAVKLLPRAGVMLLAYVAASWVTAGASATDLPEKVPVPEVFAPPAGNIAPQKLGDTPLPEERPNTDDKAASMPVPAPQPAAPQSGTGATEPAKDDAAKPSQKTVGEPQRKYQPDPRSGIAPQSPMPPEETACRAKLKELGATFTDASAASDPAGCSMPYPVSVSGLGEGVKLEPAATMDCAMAAAMADFTAQTIVPALKAAYGQRLTSIAQASAYVCRPRNGTTKLSEHAFGNALDIARFTLDDGTALDVKPEPGEKAANVLSAIREAACGPFKTVLGPGSDADHALHLHFDLAPRRNGGTYCK